MPVDVPSHELGGSEPADASLRPVRRAKYALAFWPSEPLRFPSVNVAITFTTAPESRMSPFTSAQHGDALFSVTR